MELVGCPADVHLDDVGTGDLVLVGVGYRLVYDVRDTELIVLVIAVGRRDRDAVYRAAERR